MQGQHIVKSWANTQSGIARSPGAAEFYGLVRCMSIGIEIRGLMQDLGMDFRVRTSADSSAVVGVSKRRSLGRVRHMELNQL